MIIWITILICLCAVLGGVAYFLGREHLKKFKFMQQYAQASQQLVTWTHDGREKPGMRTIVLRSNEPFAVLIGFELGIPVLGYRGFDYYGFVASDESHTAVFSTYIGTGPVTLYFLVSGNKENIQISSTDKDQQLTPHATYPPHWYQRLGFYG